MDITQACQDAYNQYYLAPPATKSTAGQKIALDILNSLPKPPKECCQFRGMPATLSINGIPTKTKISFPWKTGKYVFQQIATNASYNWLFLLGISPDRGHVWLVPKQLITQNAPHQHSKDDYWLHVSPLSPPDWMSSYGGDTTSSDFLSILQQVVDSMDKLG